MRKKKLNKALDKNEILNIINDIQNLFLQYINHNKISFIITNTVINNKIVQEGILFKVIYKKCCIVSLFVPFNNKYIININNSWVKKCIFDHFIYLLLKNNADNSEQEYIIENINFLLEKINDYDYKIKELQNIRQYFSNKYQSYIDGLILLYKL